MTLEYRVVLTLPNGKQHRHPKRNIQRAEKTIAEFPELKQRSPYYRDATIHIEERTVGEWTTTFS